MADANLEAKFRGIAAAVAELLKPEGFKKRGRILQRTNRGNLALVEFQRSVSNGAHNLRFTLNIGVLSRCLADQDGADVSKATSADAHLRRRIGTFLPEPYDKWWELDAGTAVNQLIEEIAAILKEKVVPYLEEHSSDAALVQLWKGGLAPGLTDTQRLRYLMSLEAALENEFR